MAFDKPTRNRLAAFVAEARRLITDEFTQQFQSLYGIGETSLTELSQLGHLDDAGLAVAGLLRERIDYLVKTHPEDKAGLKAAVDRLAREQAFTVLNRLAAVRMAEKRGLIAESVGNGYQSKGFKVFEQVARSGLGEIYQRYRRYLFCLFDELAIDLGVLFDRRSPQGLLFPRENTLLDLLNLLNGPELEPLWQEDETIGWIYQYYNDPAERKKMREESAAPRNSRELAVRNQFFTPRYVVEFLTDNTLGRIWYEMTRGETRLKEQCRYLVRRPTEFFLNPEETAPELPQQEGLSQEELFRQPVYIPHRPIKDPRELRMLDPACGSMHFGLYAFDLYEVIYEEAWDRGMESLHADFPDRETLLHEIPRLIIEHNIHGIDIDPRAVQIAGLSLWLRAQRSWQQQRLPARERSQIRRSNIVCAEPMPGDKTMLREFIASQFTLEEQPAFTFLLEKVFDRMALAGEAGSLLKIEEEISEAVREAKRLWKKGPQYRPGYLFAEAMPKQPEQLRLDLSGISDEGFWETAEQRIYDALEAYAQQTESESFQRRLFANDAAQGFAFIDLCRKGYDVTVMNPPFGEPSNRTIDYCKKHFPSWNQNLLCAFITRGWNWVCPLGTMAAIFDRTAIVKSTYEPFRREVLIPNPRLALMADLGWGVLDANVEVTSCVLTESARHSSSIFFDVRSDHPEQKEASLAEAILTERDGSSNLSPISTHELPMKFAHLPNAVIGYDFPEFLRRAFATFDSLEKVGFKANQGFALKADKHFRVWWEISNSKSCVVNRMFNGAGYSPFVTSLFDCAVSGVQPEDLPMDSSTRKSGLGAHRKPGVCFGKRGDYFAAHILPSDHIFTVEGQSIPVSDPFKALILVGYLNTPLVRFALNKYCGQHKYSGYVNLLPFIEPDAMGAGEQSVLHVFHASVAARSYDEIQSFFVALPNKSSITHIASELKITIESAINRAKNCEQLFQNLISKRLGLHDEDNVLIEKFAESQPVSEIPIEDVGHAGQVDIFAAHNILSYALGSVFGRWDIRYGTGERPAPELPDPFAPLSVCPPGMLQGEDGLPLAPEAGRQLRAAGHYPLDIAWDGILVDDPGHQLDLEQRLREVFTVLWHDRSEAIEQEACELLGVKSLRDYFRKPSGFFADHLKRYSKSRRQAPIYWPLSSAKGSYTLWIYYHRLSDQTLHTALADFVDPKIKDVRAEISLLRESNNNRSRLEELLDLEGELLDFQAEIERIIKLPWQPNLNDGVLITAAPLWRLFRLPKWQKDLKGCWDKLEKGEYDWAHLAYSIWPKRVEEVCKKDRSIAIAHGLEHLCQVEPPKPKAKRGRKKAE